MQGSSFIKIEEYYFQLHFCVSLSIQNIFFYPLLHHIISNLVLDNLKFKKLLEQQGKS